jgi:replicative DNA helicase
MKKTYTNEQSELTVLEAVIFDNKRLDVIDWLKAEHFGKEAHRLIWATMVDLYKESLPVDSANLMKKLIKDPEARLLAVKLTGLVPTDSYEDKARMVYDLFLARKLMNLFAETATRMDYDDIHDVIDGLISQTETLKDLPNSEISVDFKEAIAPSIKEVKERAKEPKEKGFSSNFFPTFNDMVGGLMPGNMVSIEGMKKHGKTTFATALALDFAINQNIPTAIFSLEVPKDELIWKGISMILDFEYNKFRNPAKYKHTIDSELTELERNALRMFENANVQIVDEPFLNEYDITLAIKRLIKQKGTQFVMIDYVGLVNTRDKHESRERQIAHLTRYFKGLAKKLKVVICLLSQQNRDGDIAESLGIRRDSDFCFSVTKPILLPPAPANKPYGYKNMNSETIPTPIDEDTYVIKLEDARHSRHASKAFLCKYQGHKFREYIDITGLESYYHHTNEKDII